MSLNFQIFFNTLHKKSAFIIWVLCWQNFVTFWLFMVTIKALCFVLYWSVFCHYWSCVNVFCVIIASITIRKHLFLFYLWICFQNIDLSRSHLRHFVFSNFTLSLIVFEPIRLLPVYFFAAYAISMLNFLY